MLELFESNNNVAREDTVYSIPTYFRGITLDKNVEFTYAESAMCKVKRKDNTYILLIFVNCILF
jgi:hypothetical protein